MQCIAVQCSAVPYSTVQYSAVQCSAVHCCAVQCSAVQCSAAQCNVLYSTVQYTSVECSTVHCSAVQCSAVQCTVQYSAGYAYHVVILPEFFREFDNPEMSNLIKIRSLGTEWMAERQANRQADSLTDRQDVRQAGT